MEQPNAYDESPSLAGDALLSLALDVAILDDHEFSEVRDFAERAALVMRKRVAAYDEHQQHTA